MFNDLSSISQYFGSRRSGRPRDMVEPGPGAGELKSILQKALRTPDHGKLSPWRVVIIDKSQRSLLSQKLKQAYQNETPDAGRAELEAMDMFARHAPTLLVILSSPQTSSKIPLWEQELSCGAFCMNVLHNIHAAGFVGGWITGWPTFNNDVRNLFGESGERIAGFMFAGTAKKALEERPRPEYDKIISSWEI